MTSTIANMPSGSEYLDSIFLDDFHGLPSVSKGKYNKVYDEFQKWNKSKGSTPVSEQVLLAYFSEVAQKMKPSTVLAYYSMLKATLRIRDDIDVSSYNKLANFVKAQKIAYEPIQAKMFTEENIEKFINEASDVVWLDVKVACIFGVCGAYSTSKLVNVKVDQIKKYNNMFLVTVSKTETNDKRSFKITGTFFSTVQKYAALRPVGHAGHDRFFIKYHNGKCTSQPIGKNKLAGMPRRVAVYLNLPEPERFTGHSFRRTSNNILLNNLNSDAEQDRDDSLDCSATSAFLKNNVNYAAAHVCTLQCGQVKCPSEENENSVFHSFDVLKPSDYIVRDLTAALFDTEPICRWIVAYTHITEPVDSVNIKEKFEAITRSIPNNVKVIEKFIRTNTTHATAAYVVIYGVNCRCGKQQFDTPSIKSEDTLNSYDFTIDIVKDEKIE